MQEAQMMQPPPQVPTVFATADALPDVELESAIERTLKALHREIRQKRLPRAKAAMKPTWDNYEAALHSYYASQSSPNVREAAKDKDFIVEIPELSDQVDDMTALIYDVYQAAGESVVFAAEGGESEEKVRLMMDLIRAEDRACNAQAERQKFAFNLINYRFGAMKACWEYKSRPVRRWVPATPEEAMAHLQAYGSAWIPSPEEVAAAQIAGRLIQPMICIVESQDRDNYPERNVRPDRLALEDPTRDSMDDQPSVHQVFYHTKQEMEAVGSYHNLHKLQSPDGGGRVGFTNEKTHPQDGRIGACGDNYEVVESWFSPDWKAVFKDAQVVNPVPVIQRLANLFRFHVSEFDVPQRWCFHTVEAEGAVLKFYPNFLARPMEYPFAACSYIPGEGLIGLSLPDRISDLNAALHVIANLWVKNVRKMCYGSKALNTTVPVDSDELDKLDTDEGVAHLPGNMPLGDMLQFYRPPDVKGAAVALINFIGSKMQSFGVPAIMKGEGDAETATQDTINNRRGQTKVNSLAARVVSQVLIPITLKRMGSMACQQDRDRWVDILGEDGATLRPRLVSPADLTDKVRAIGLGSWDAIERKMLAQQFTGIINVLSRNPDNPLVIELLTIQMELMGVDRGIIDRVRKSSGTATSLWEEAAALQRGPDSDVKVRPMDDHMAALTMLDMLLQQKPELATWQNVQRYKDEHILFYKQQMMQAQLAAQAKGAGQQPQPGQAAKGKDGGSEPKRLPQPPGRASDGIGTTAQSTGFSSPPDNGAQTNGGVTGRAAVQA